MRKTLFYIPEMIGSWPLFGPGVMLAVWAVAVVAILTVFVSQHRRREAVEQLPLLLLIGAVILWLMPRLVEPGRGLPIQGYGVMLLLGTLSGLWLAVYRARRRGIEPEAIYSLAFGMFVAGIVGARLFYVIEYWQEYRRDTWGETLAAVFSVAAGGLVVYGSVFGAAVAFVYFTRRHKLPVLRTADCIAPSLVLGLMFGRIGCLLNGCCFGGACDLPWAVTFPQGSPPYRAQVAAGELYLHGLKLDGRHDAPAIIASVEPQSSAERAGLRSGQQIVAVDQMAANTAAQAIELLLQHGGTGREVVILTADDAREHRLALPEAAERSLPVHPTQIYSATNALLIFCFLLALEPFCRRDGELTVALFIVYPVTRFLIEMIRTDEASIFGTGMSISQNVSLLVLAATLVLFWYVRRREPRAV